jgi:hypothetical protein
MAEADSQITGKTVAGKASYVWQEMKMGMWAAGCQLHEVDEAMGAGLNEDRNQKI